MEYEHSNAIRDFPGLYTSESHSHKKETECSDDDKHAKKDILIGKRKDKKDKKDKEKGYAALEGESSADECYEFRSPTKSKKSKSFKFTSKSKDKREKSRDKEKDVVEKKKDKDKRIDKKNEKDKFKSDRKEKVGDIAEELPIFGVSLELAVERSRCHDGINLPLPFRECIDYLQMYGMGFENIYKVSSPKSKIVHLKKMYNQRENVDLAEHDVPTITGLLKMFLRELPEPIFTSEMLVRFEEAGAILNVGMREKHLKILVKNLPALNYLILSWIMVHLHNVTVNEKYTKMVAQSLGVALSSTLQTSQRLLTALIYHTPTLFEDTELIPYIPPLTCTAQLPESKDLMEKELKKQESLLSQIHDEMNAGFISKQREELLWEVQRIITQLKRKIRSKRELPDKHSEDKAESCENIKNVENVESENTQPFNKVSSQEAMNVSDTGHASTPKNITDDKKEEETKKKEVTFENKDGCSYDSSEFPTENANLIGAEDGSNSFDYSECQEDNVKDTQPEKENEEIPCFSLNQDKDIMLLTLKNKALQQHRNQLIEKIEAERNEVLNLKSRLKEMNANSQDMMPLNISNGRNLEEIMNLLQNENQILHIKKINLVRQIVEQQEICMDLNVKLLLLNTTV